MNFKELHTRPASSLPQLSLSVFSLSVLLGRRRASIGASAFAVLGGHLEFGKNYLQWHGTRAELVVTEAELCKEILSNKDGFYPKPKVRAYAKKIFGNGLPQLEGENWAKSRMLANHAFHGQSLKMDQLRMIQCYLDRGSFRYRNTVRVANFRLAKLALHTDTNAKLDL